MVIGSIWQTAVDSRGAKRVVDGDGLELDPQRGEVGATAAAYGDAQLVLQHLPGPPLGADAADGDRQPQRVGQVAELDADQRAGMRHQRGELGTFGQSFGHAPDPEAISG